ncbi:MAG: polysaccharide pyruvyl transferase family protein [Clostridiales bacterium]|nr:polysaccharide pyruvyl transferase family protein [Clostridiales bacterium]
MNKIKSFIYLVFVFAVRQPKKLINIIKKAFRKNRTLFLIDTPCYGNLGDQLIAVGEKEWLKKYFINEEIREITHSELLKDRRCRLFLSGVKKGDILFIQGGGNINDRYMNCENIRRTIISKCKNNKIIIFPQSIYFSDSPEGKRIAAETSRIYGEHPDLTVMTRDEKSREIAEKMFPFSKVKLYPDMALFLFGKLSKENTERSGILLCFRNDAESYFPLGEKKALKARLEKLYPVKFSDTHVYREVYPDKRLTEIKAKLDEFSRAELIITDRLHGVIFSVLSGTPCIALRSADHKITEGVKWFGGYNGVTLASSLHEAGETAEKMKEINYLSAPDMSEFFEDMYRELSL